jgi:hypothetical protein
MISRTLVACRRASVSASLLACVAAALALSASPALAAEEPEAACANLQEPLRKETEQRRKESNISPTTGKPYSTGLSDCRAYEVVSPPYKQGHDAEPIDENFVSAFGLPVAPDGATVGFESQGAFSGAENFQVVQVPTNVYLSQRGASGWSTRSAFAPAEFVDKPSIFGLDGDASPDLRSGRLGCGENSRGKGDANEAVVQSVACALRQPNGSWVGTPTYYNLRDEAASGGGGNYLGAATAGAESYYLGTSNAVTRAFVQSLRPLLPSDELSFPGTNTAGIYEIAGLGTASPVLRLVNFENNFENNKREGNELKFVEPGLSAHAPYFGDHWVTQSVDGSQYHAISKSGETVFFTATPAGSEVHAHTLYARAPCVAGPHCAYVEAVDNEGRVEREGPTDVRGEPTGRETVVVSAQAAPPECTGACALSLPERKGATFQAASADGSKVFFTTKQALLNSDTNSDYDLYEYHFVTKKEADEGKKPQLTLISGGEPMTKVTGLVRSSPDGSHVYFVEKGRIPNAINKNTWHTQSGKGEEEAVLEGSNLYGYDTVTREIKFVAAISVEQTSATESQDWKRNAQTTPDGRYLVFSVANVQLAGDLNKKGATVGDAVYRYDFQTGELTWVSHSALPTSEATYEGKNAFIAPLSGTWIGADANVDDWNRAITGCPTKGERSESEELEFKCPEGTYDGEYIIFVTPERLQAGDINNERDVYEWHCASPCTGEGTVSMISDGHDPQGVRSIKSEAEEGTATMSASGSDIFFATHTRLVGQDTDVLRDVYDARVGGGFPAPAAGPACLGEACQPQSSPPSFGPATSSLFTAGGNLTPPGPGPPATVTATVTITKTKLAADSLLLTVKMSPGGTVKISGNGLKTTIEKNLTAGTHQIRVALNKAGRTMRKRHKRTTVRVSLTAGKQAVAATKVVRL